jgi:glycosyltransferase involved in cell wall biosynthesis
VNRGSRVAIIIPTFNDGATVEAAVASARGQAGSEVVVVDDGSSDAAALTVLKRLEADGVRVLFRENQGSSAARMAGVAATSSPYVFPLDADDALLPGAATVMADYLDTHPEVAAVWGDLQLVGGRTHVRRKAQRLDPWLVTFVNDQPSGALVRREVLQAVGGWRSPKSELPNCSWDWNFWMDLAERGYQGHHVGAVTMRYAVRESGVNSFCLSHQEEIFDALRMRHPGLFAARPENRRHSELRVAAQFVVLLVQIVPGLRLGLRKRLVTAACHVAYRRGGYLRPVRRRWTRRRMGARSSKRAAVAK